MHDNERTASTRLLRACWDAVPLLVSVPYLILDNGVYVNQARHASLLLLIRHEDAIGSAQARETRYEGAPGPEQCG